MQIHLPDDALPMIEKKASAAGFAGRITAYIVHLIATDGKDDFGAPKESSLAGRSKEQILAMISAGIDSGTATAFADEEWRALHARLDATNSTSAEN